jgi:hypothetical protein
VVGPSARQRLDAAQGALGSALATRVADGQRLGHAGVRRSAALLPGRRQGYDTARSYAAGASDTGDYTGPNQRGGDGIGMHLVLGDGEGGHVPLYS